MSDKFKVFFDYRKAQGKTRSATKRLAGGSDTNSVELGPWLEVESNQKMIYNMRGFYVVKPNSENVLKWGISGLDGKSGTYGRLRQYVNEYGFAEDLNPCAGVKLLYLAGTVYNENVATVNTAVYRKELQIKRHFRSDAIRGRGFERQFLDRIDELFKLIDDKSNKIWEDIETERRVSERLKEAEIQPDDRVVKILSHTTKGGKSQAKTKYLVKWNRPYILTEKKKVNREFVTTTKEIFETEEPANKIITYLDGSKMLETYKVLHPDGKFRD